MSTTTPSDLLSLPEGGGAVSGLGETFSPDLFTGTGNYSVPIELPEGRGGFGPELALSYSSGSGNGPVGLGWQLGVAKIQRKTSQGVPRYQGGDTFVLAGAEDLVPVEEAAGVTRFRPRTEGAFARIERDRSGGGDVWRVRSRNGRTSVFGTPGVPPADDPAVVADPDDPSRIFAWHLTEKADVFGNRIVYDYLRDRGEDGPHRFDQLYLERIRYADHGQDGDEDFLVSVTFHYQDRPDAFSDRRAGFEIRTRRRLERIEVRTHAGADRLSRVYHLGYLDAESEGAVNGVSLLTRVQGVGHDGEATQELPPLELGYTAFEPQERDFLRVTGPDLPSTSLADPDLELVDLTGQGLPDFLETREASVRVWRNRGDGTFGRPREMPEAPAGMRLSAPGVQLLDADGDGRTDLVISDGTDFGYYPARFEGLSRPGWDRRSFRRPAVAPSFDLEDPEVALVDLTGDGVTDALRNGSRLECFFHHPRDGWHLDRRVERGDLTRFPAASFADPRLRFADMSGDGLQDVVMISGGVVEYWPSLGHGDFGEPVAMASSPRFPHGWDPARVLLGDVDGDGLADVVYVDHARVTLWLNRGGDGWSAPIVIAGTPPVSSGVDLRLVDLLGTGVRGILWSAEAGAAGRSRTFFLDLTGGVKPYLLTRIDNRMGALTRVEYAPSTRSYLADEARPETRWRTTLPFPVQVVRRVESVDALSGGKLTVEYAYHHGYWDGEEREFRGFARVDQHDTETFERYHQEGLHPGGVFQAVAAARFSPPVETRHWFHVGPVSDGRDDWVEPDLLHEIWAGDPNVLERPAEVAALLAGLPRRDRRDALRALRGRTLRTELYALDGSEREDRPFTVTEHLHGMREEEPPGAGEERRRIFFSHALGQRSSRWERGEDPMHRFAFTADHDAYGQARAAVEVAVPRGRGFETPPSPEEPMLVSATFTDFAQSDSEELYKVDSTCRATSYEIVDDGSHGVFELRDGALDASLPREVLSQAVSYFDGDAFVGLPWGQIGDYGALTRSETLVLTEERLASAWRSGETVLDPPEIPPYLDPASLEPGGVPWSGEYPQAFRDALPALAGHVFRDGEGEHERGYFVAQRRLRYDFHDGPGRGLVTVHRGPLGHDLSVTYDAYHLLPVTLTDAAGLLTLADYDDRTLQPAEVTGPNDHRTAYAYTPLGLLESITVRGKEGESVGDSAASPSTRFEYDLLAFHLGAQPVSVRTVKRQHHVHDTEVPLPERDATLETVDYSDGFSRVLQSRSQAEDTLFGVPDPSQPSLADAGLPADVDLAPGDAVGTVRSLADPSHVVVSGWQVYDNKGRAVERYEPFFASGWQPTPEADARLGQKITTYLDSLGRPVRVVYPNGAESRVIHGVPIALDQPETFEPSPWVITTYDPGDNGGRTHPGDPDADPGHRDTPNSVELDALGRAVRRISRLGTDPADEVVTLQAFDLEGNLLTVTDALGRVALRNEHDLAGRVLRAESLDAGLRRTVYDALGRTLEIRDAKGALELTAYDPLGRLSRVWARDDGSGAVTLRQQVEYGDAGDPAQAPAERDAERALGRLGKPVRHFDESGLVTFEGYDFRGNPLESVRRVFSDSALLAGFDPAPAGWQIGPFTVDWQDPATEALLAADEYRLSHRWDALGRLRRSLYPQDVDGERRELVPRYNRAGGFAGVELDGETFVEHVAYDARGQRILVAYGNGVMTRLAYDPLTFRLSRLRSEPFVLAGDATYQPTGAVLQDVGYRYDLAGNVVTVEDRSPGCGVPGSVQGLGALDRQLTYDALHRLASATGREQATAPPASPWDDAVKSQDPTLTRAYAESYQYDAVGNLLTLQHQAPGGDFTRHYALSPGTGPADGNRLHRLSVGQTDVDYAYDAAGNLLDETTSRHFEWDHADRLRTYRTQTAGAEPSVFARYLYGADGRRVQKLVRRQGGGYDVTIYVGGVFEHHRSVQGATVLENDTLHVMDAESRLATRRVGAPFPGDSSPQVQYHLGDHLGSSQLVVDAAGAWVRREEHTPYGETSFGGFAAKRYRFTGKERDEESGLYYHGARYYAPWLARWASTDPIGLRDGINVYLYAHANPMSFFDPDGAKNVPANAVDRQIMMMTDPQLFNYLKHQRTDAQRAAFADQASGWFKKRAWAMINKYGMDVAYSFPPASIKGSVPKAAPAAPAASPPARGDGAGGYGAADPGVGANAPYSDQEDFTPRPLTPDQQARDAIERNYGVVSVDIVAISGTDETTPHSDQLWDARLVTVGEIDLPNAKEGVDNILAAADGDPIGRLIIYSHGGEHHFELGTDSLADVDVNPGNMDDDAKELLRLKGAFRRDGVLEIRACRCGTSEVLMQWLADNLEVRVEATEGLVSPLLGVTMDGDDVVFEPQRK